MLFASCLCVGTALGQSAAVEQYAEQGQRALAQGNYVEAQAAFEKLRQLEPGVAEVHANLGLIYFQQKKFDQAVPALRQALKLKPTLPRTDTLLAMSLSELGHYDEALPGLEKGFRRSTDTATKRMCGLQLMRAYTGLQQDSKAVGTALELNRLYPQDPEVLYHTGKIFGNFAFLTMQKLAQVAPNSIWWHQAMAEAYESQGTYDAAIGEYRQVLAADPRRFGIHYRLGRTLLARSRQTNSSDDVTEALKEFQDELEIDPSNANAAYELAEMYRRAGQLQEAQEYFEKALKDYPDFAEAHLGLGSVLTSLRKPEEALSHLKKTLDIDPRNDVAWYRLSQIQKTLGNTAEQQKALTEFKRLREKPRQQEPAKDIFSPTDLTKQELDQDAPQ